MFLTGYYTERGYDFYGKSYFTINYLDINNINSLLKLVSEKIPYMDSLDRILMQNFNN